jgi:hypothetical protein
LTTDSRFAMARFNTNGFVDSTFGASGRVTTNFVASDHGGSTALAHTDVAIARYRADGRSTPRSRATDG